MMTVTAHEPANPGSPVEWDVLIPQDRRKVGRVERHRKHVDNFVVTEDRYPDRQDRPLQHRPGEEVRDVRLPRTDDTVDRLTVSLARGQLAIRSGGADEFLRGGVVETNRKPLDLQRLPDLAC